jgi:hypothetical protein
MLFNQLVQLQVSNALGPMREATSKEKYMVAKINGVSSQRCSANSTSAKP